MKTFKSFFPLLSNNVDLVYLDSAATTPMPESVIERQNFFCRQENAAVHRSFYSLAEEATATYESVRSEVARFFGVDSSEIVFNSGSTAGCNTVALGWLAHVLSPGDEVVISLLEHHSAFLPFIEVAQRCGAKVRFLPIDISGRFCQDDILATITDRTRFVVCTAGSNVIGASSDFSSLLVRAKAVGAAFFLDGAQIAPRQRFDLENMGVDFFVCSAHKMCGPTGLGVLYVNKSRKNECFPWMLGGGMVQEVHQEGAEYAKLPSLWEVGSPPVQQVVAFGATLEFLDSVDFELLHAHEAYLTRMFLAGVADLPAVTVVGDRDRLSKDGHLVSFFVEEMHAHDVAFYLAKKNIAVRSGYHCAQPLHEALGIPHTVRASWYLYTQEYDVERLVNAIRELVL